MPRIRHKITEVLNIQPYKDCKALTDKELVDHEAECRREIVRLVLSLTIHVGTCTAHGVLSAGTSLPLHLPVVVWIAYSLTKTAKRHRAVRAEIQTNRNGLKLKKLPARRFAAPVALALLSPILSALGADIINEIVCTLAGSDILLCGNSDGVTVGEHETPDDSGFKIVTASEADCSYTELSITEAASGAAIDELLEKWQDQLIRGVSDEFAELVAVMDTGNRANVPGYYQIRCNVCHKQITDGFSCTECHDFDLCRECYVGVRHKDAKQHVYNEFKVEEELTQIQRIMGSLRRENVVIESGRGGYVQCNKCYSTITTPTSRSRLRQQELVFYYKCKNCPDFDVCSKCFPEEAPSAVHNEHTFSMILATDDEATISRLSPTQSRRSLTPQPPLSPRPPPSPRPSRSPRPSLSPLPLSPPPSRSPRTSLSPLPVSPQPPRSPRPSLPSSISRSPRPSISSAPSRSPRPQYSPDAPSYISRQGSSSSGELLASPMTSLFQPGSSPFSSKVPSSPPPAYSVINPEDIWHPGLSSIWCDACAKPILGDKRLTCADSDCLKTGSVDLHVECGANWEGGVHLNTHRMRTLYKVN